MGKNRTYWSYLIEPFFTSCGIIAMPVFCRAFNALLRNYFDVLNHYKHRSSVPLININFDLQIRSLVICRKESDNSNSTKHLLRILYRLNTVCTTQNVLCKCLFLLSCLKIKRGEDNRAFP